MPSLARRRMAALRCTVPLGALLLGACTADPVAWTAGAERRLAAPTPSADAAPEEAAEALLRRTVAGAVAGFPAPAPARITAPGAMPHAEHAAMEHAAMGHAMPAAGGPSAPAPVDTSAVATVPAGLQPHVAAACPGSVRMVRGRGGEMVAVWWAPRPDGRAALLSTRSPDGGAAWYVPIPVDTVDRSEAGCARPAPSLAVDTINGFVHVAYSLVAPEGKGVFYAHRMDPRAPFERPQVIVYGDRPAATAVTSEGDLVLVAYEDPNTGGRPFVSLAVSRTGGHTWDERFPASAGSMSAERPVVALRGARVALGWVERTAPRTLASTDDPRSATVALPTGVVVRVGEVVRPTAPAAR